MSYSQSSSMSQNPYLILTAAQRYEIGKRAAKNGIVASIRYYAQKYPDLPLMETTI